MRTIPALLLFLMTPLLAIAQTAPPPNQPITQSPLFWGWVIALSVAVVAFVWASIVISRRRGGPPSRPRTS